jgi:predicted ATPase
MIAGLSLSRFKRFSSLELDLAPLTVLTGLNSAGKSTAIQGLLLLREALRSVDDHVSLHDTEGLALGEPDDVLFRGSSEETIELRVRAESIDEWASVKLGIPAGERALYLTRLECSPTDRCPPALIAPEPTFTYLCAERYGPRDILPAEPNNAARLGIGIRGQHTAQVLSLLDRKEVAEARLAPASQDERIGALRFLGRQTERWLARILGSEGVMRIEARWIDGTSVTSLRFQTPEAQAEWTRPHNVGFGVSYVLPIIVAALQAPPGGLLIVENPEAHLHPAGQSAIGAFLAQVSADGVQIVLETHSDHVINGIRRAVADKSASLEPEDVAIIFFRPDANHGQAHVRIALRETGELSAWPAGFFDQIEADLGAIARARRERRRP